MECGGLPAAGGPDAASTTSTVPTVFQGRTANI
jgi:hypothetical protein